MEHSKLTLVGMTAIFSILIMLAIGSCNKQKEIDQRPVLAPTEEKLQSIDVSEIPADGQAHVVYTDPAGFHVIKVKMIRINTDNISSYSTHIVWVEYIGIGSRGGDLKLIGGSH